MIRLDYTYSSIGVKELKKYESEIKTIVENFKEKKCEGNEYLGWYQFPNQISEDEIEKIENTALKIKQESQTFVVCGIGGSYLGARSVIEAIKGYYGSDIEIIYLGNTFDERYIKDTIEYLKKRDFSVNVISKSGSTLETAVAFRLLKDVLIEKYGGKANGRIFVTTDENDGCLRELAEKEKFCSFVIPRDVGGRYSVFTAVGLLPLAVAGVDIRLFIEGARHAYKEFQEECLEKNSAYQYAAYRFCQHMKKNKKVETFVSYSPYLNMVAEWWKQLYGESEGKQEKGLFPAKMNFSTDLHSLGQFVQQGSKLLFITQLKVLEKGDLYIPKDENNIDGLNYLEKISVAEINNIAQEGTNSAHYNLGLVDNLTLVLEDLSEKSVGHLLYFFMCSCMISSFLLGVNPFNQPGVEFYKQEMKKMLKKE